MGAALGMQGCSQNSSTSLRAAVLSSVQAGRDETWPQPREDVAALLAAAANPA